MAIVLRANRTNRASQNCFIFLRRANIARLRNQPANRRTQIMNTNTKKLEGKVAVVTGASKGIGAGIAKEFAAEGGSVVVNYASAKHGADRVVDEITKRGGKAIAVQANVARKAEVERLFAAAEKAFGKIDILVNNAGVYEFVPVEEVTEKQFHRMFDTNVLGMLLVTQEAIKHFNSNGGSIVNIGSLASSLTPPTAVVYNATKGAVDAITRTLAKELGPKKIRVNSINPGMVVTEGAVAGGYTEGDMRKMFESQTPLGRVGQTDDIAPAAVFFASDDSKWITGETLVIAGGLR
jgi:3-oxoacyl-[acyl-carrier protein] reductase